MKIAYAWVLRFVVVSLLVVLSACGSADPTTEPGAAVPGISIAITGSDCPSVEINLNEQVTWTNEDSVEHILRVEYPDGEKLVDLGVLQPGDWASVTFPQAGTYPYFCTADSGAGGTITVRP